MQARIEALDAVQLGLEVMMDSERQSSALRIMKQHLVRLAKGAWAAHLHIWRHNSRRFFAMMERQSRAMLLVQRSLLRLQKGVVGVGLNGWRANLVESKTEQMQLELERKAMQLLILQSGR